MSEDGSHPPGRSGAENREAPRVPGRVYYHADRLEGTGLIEDISVKGAHIVDPKQRLQPGATVSLSFFAGENDARIDIDAEVVRKTDRGFAVRFVRVDSRVQELLLATVPRLSSK